MTKRFGVYVHIPFCAERCDYCAFVTYVGMDDLHERYARAVIAELSASQATSPIPKATSVYFGGGTPSRVAPELLGQILEVIPRTSTCEVTVEVNPEDATVENLRTWVALGVTRFSLGIQSTAPHVLAELGRVHRGDGARALAQRVHESGVATWSMDLIVGANTETDSDLMESLEILIDHPARPPHVSCYLLSVEKGTPLSLDPTRHPDDDVLARRYEMADRYLSEHGYCWYEISNWSLLGHESSHNQLYWDREEYLGLGVGAHSYRTGRRSWNLANVTTYIERIENAEGVLGGEECIDEKTSRFESLALELRTRRGLAWPHECDLSSLAGYVVSSEGRLVLTRHGRLMANEVTHRLDALLEPSSRRGTSGH